MSEAVIKSGWLYREELVSGAVSAWKKRWNVLTLHKLCWFKHNQVPHSEIDAYTGLHPHTRATNTQSIGHGRGGAAIARPRTRPPRSMVGNR